jgi:uncharacterized protein (DUF885 family)
VRAGLRLALALALAAAALVARAPVASAESAETIELGHVADRYYWALQNRLLRPNFSPQANRYWVSKLEALEWRLGAIDRRKLGPQARVTYRMLAADLKEQRAYVTEGWLSRDINGTESPAQTLAGVATNDAIRTVNDWKWTIKTLKNSERFMDTYIDTLEAGLDRGTPQTREAVRSAIRSLDVLTSADPKANPFLAMEAAMARTLAGKPQLEPLRAELRQVVRDTVIPSHKKLQTFLRQRYLPRAGALGADRKAYQHHMRRHLGPDHARPEELHAWGRAEVDRLTRELERTARQISPKARSLSSFMAGLKRREEHRYASPQDLIDASYAEIDRARELARAHVPVPRTRVTVKPVARHQQDTVAAQYYASGPGEGTMEVNTGPLLASQRRYELATLVTHEVYGGHHLAAMYADKAGNQLPDYRAGHASTAFDEGWALYMEDLRDQQGGFTPEERVGFLVNHLWRAARLVVDTGLHTGTMSPAQARNYFQKSTFVDRQAASAEIQRYIDWPGQALAYYVGKREILKIRAEAERILGPRFDARRFHARMLRHGSMPMAELRGQMISWANRRNGQLRKATPTAARPAASASKKQVVRSLRSKKWAGKGRPQPGSVAATPRKAPRPAKARPAQGRSGPRR